MRLILFALRRPMTVIVALVGVVLGCFVALWQMPIDIFPSLNLPVIYVAQPFGGMDPAQMEGYLANYYEYHFLYITGIHHVESRNIQGTSLMKLYFHPGTNMAQAMAETVNYVNRARAFMPPGTVSPFVMRFDTGSVPVGYLVLSSEKRSIGEIQDLALFRVRPMFAGLPGVSAPPPFGGNQRTVVVTVDPERLRAYDMTPDDIVNALAQGNAISPSGNLPLAGKYPFVPVNSVVRDVHDLETIPLRAGPRAPVYIRDVGYVQDSSDAPTGYALVNGRRSVYILVTKRADASTLSVVRAVKAALPDMQAILPPDIHVSYEFDQSPYVTRSIWGVASEGALGAVLVGLMILLFLRDGRSALIVLLNIPLALMAAVVALWLSGQTINVMTLGGLALAIGILVDEATVEIENIHTQMSHAPSIARAVRLGNAQTALPRLLAMLCILAVFISSFFMQGALRAMFVPLSLAVGFSMVASYLLSSTFVPVLSVWLLRHVRLGTVGLPNRACPTAGQASSGTHANPARHSRILPLDWLPAVSFDRFRQGYEWVLARIVRFRWGLAAAYLGVSSAIIWGLGSRLGTEIFPTIDTGQFRLRIRAPDGTDIDRTEQIALTALKVIGETAGADNVQMTLGYLGTIPSSYPINAVFQWMRGPEEAVMWVALKRESGIHVEQLKGQLREKLAEALPGVQFSFEPADIINEVMSFGSPTPVEVAVSGPDFSQTRSYAAKIMDEMGKIAGLRDLQIVQSLDYPMVQVDVDRKKAGTVYVTPVDVSRSLIEATSSSRFTVPNFWADPKTGIGYQVQVEVPRAIVRSPKGISPVGSIGDLKMVPVKQNAAGQVLVRDVAALSTGTMPGEIDRYNMKRQISMAANIAGTDLGSVSREVAAALGRAGKPPGGVKVEVRGQIPPMRDMLAGLALGLGMAIVVIFLLLCANFQSLRLSLVAVSTAPAAVAGVVLMLYLTRTTLNIQSLIGAIMAVGVAMANAILLVTFAESRRRRGQPAIAAAVEGAGSRLRPILMTTCAMIGGMLPMALALGESGQQNAPLGRAVIGGLMAATLLVLPSVFALVQSRASTESASLDPDDPESVYHTHSAIPGVA
ncbi:MAG: efflux RND transporter permease subunit [Thermoguttaceae bacterium]|jgi:multidrug efflux pump subunit AcrB